MNVVAVHESPEPLEDGEWVKVQSKKEKSLEKPKPMDQGNKPYLTKNGGVTITYAQSEVAKEPVACQNPHVSQVAEANMTSMSWPPKLGKPSSPNLDIPPMVTPIFMPKPLLASPIPPGFHILSPHIPPLHNNETDVTLPISLEVNHAPKPVVVLPDTVPLMPALRDENTRVDKGIPPPLVTLLLEPVGTNAGLDSRAVEFNMEEDDLLAGEERNELVDEGIANPIVEGEIHGLLKPDDEEDPPLDYYSEGSYHSTNSLHTSNSNNSMMHILEGRTVHTAAISNSGSSKKKFLEDEGDTGSSVLMGAKKSKI